MSRSSRSRGARQRSKNVRKASQRRNLQARPQQPIPDNTTVRTTVATVAAWSGVALGLVDVYPSLFPWRTSSDQVLGVVICVLIAALGARLSQLSTKNRLDLLIVFIIVTLLLVIGMDAMTISTTAGS